MRYNGGMDSSVDVPALRRALLELHRVLLHAQRREMEHQLGRPMGPSELMQAAIDDLRFSWLNELFSPLAALDGAIAEGDEPLINATVERIRAVLYEPDPESGFGRRYLRALGEQPTAEQLHRDVVAALGG